MTRSARPKRPIVCAAGRCVDACPMNLVPTRLALAARYKNPELAAQYNIRACVECGSCAYVCPAKLNLVQLIREGKVQLNALGNAVDGRPGYDFRTWPRHHDVVVISQVYYI